MEGALSCSQLSAGEEAVGIDALSDEVLLTILEQASRGKGHFVLRIELPLVRKRWRDAIYSAKGRVSLMLLQSFFDKRQANSVPYRYAAGGSIVRCIVLDFDAEPQFAQLSVDGRRHYPFRTVARWIHKNVTNGNITYPCKFQACSEDPGHPGSAEV